MIQKEPLISVIMPVYNVKQYLERSINSILNQNYHKLEIVIVDDGSTDGSGELCDVYQKRDGRVRVFHKENGGQATARNVGIDHSSGEVIAFVDSDDYIASDYLQKMLLVMQEEQCDIVQCAYSKIYQNGDHIPCGQRRLRENGRDIQRLLYDKKNCPEPFDVLWNKLYKRRLWERIAFPDGRIHEDYAIAYRIFYRAEKIAVIPDILYYYSVREGSTMRTRGIKSLLDWREAEKERWEFYRKEGLGQLAASSMKSYYYRTAACVRSGIMEKEQRREYASICKELAGKIYKSHEYGVKEKAGVLWTQMRWMK